MKRYKYEPDEQGTQAYMTYKVVEVPTGNIIKSDVPHKENRHMINFLNGGGGFNGWTPEFFLQRIPI